jgi:hypothetical protein
LGAIVAGASASWPFPFEEGTLPDDVSKIIQEIMDLTGMKQVALAKEDRR